MPNKMLIDATHPEETRVVVLRGQRVEEFDFESASRKQLRGNIYLAKVTRVEPSLQAAFVDYGGNRHGFLAFSEIHPDYYQIPVADRQALIAEDERAQRAADAEADHRVVRHQRRSHLRRDELKSEPVEAQVENEVESEVETEHDIENDVAAMAACSEQIAPEADLADRMATDAPAAAEVAVEATTTEGGESLAHSPAATKVPIELAQLESSSAAEPIPSESIEGSQDANHVEAAGDDITAPAAGVDGDASENQSVSPSANITEVNGSEGDEEVVESVGGADAMEEVPERMPRLRRQYKIQEVIKRRQVMLVQVVKEERGTKGAALTTYLSLAGRYSVLMPNTARGGGISRKITSADDRRRLKEIAQELEVPEGMGVILRTAGASRTKTEVKRDFEYLLRLWETVRDLTLKSTAPKLVYEEGSLVKRSIRDLYNKDIDEILVAGDAAYQEAKEFMRMLMPSHAKNVKPYRDGLPIFTRHGIESQLDAMFTPVMQLRSGGYIVLNQAEALVAIDVNSGRATREHHIEDTALKTNLEAAEEIARQLRLRDLAGLIVIDFIDMDEKRNNRAVERRLKECLRHDRARIQVGHISHFGLLEMSRQRIRSSVLESSTEKCPHCGGTGHVRSVSSVTLQILRSLEEMLLKGATHNLAVRTRSEIALYLLNHKRAHLRALEERFRIAIMVDADSGIGGQVAYLIEKGEQVHSLEQAKALAAQAPAAAPIEQEEEESFTAEDEAPEFEDVAAGRSDEEAIDPAEPSRFHEEEHNHGDGHEPAQEQDQGRKRRRRRRGRRGGEGRDDGALQRDPVATPISPEQPAHVAAGEHEDGDEFVELPAADASRAGNAELAAESDGEGERRRRRRGRRGGRRNRRDRDGGEAAAPETEVLEPEFAGVTPDLAGVSDLDDAPMPVINMQSPPAIAERQADVPANAQARAQDKPSSQTAQSNLSSTTTFGSAPRRSTVREPALTSLPDEATEPAPSLTSSPVPEEPVISSSVASEDSDRPRRSGWWSKRVLGRH
jgi:ribonuclease E